MKKRLPRINVVLAIASLIVAILTWLFPFGPAGPSPFSFKPSPPTQDTATLVTVSSFTLTPYYTNTQTLPVYTTITFTPTAALAESGTLPTALTAGPRPGTYTMQTGEFINCIARRFNVDFYELLALNGLF